MAYGPANAPTAPTELTVAIAAPAVFPVKRLEETLQKMGSEAMIPEAAMQNPATATASEGMVPAAANPAAATTNRSGRERKLRARLAKNMAKYWLDWPLRFTSRKDRRLTLGNALTGALRVALNEAGVPMWLKTPMRELVTEGGRVVGLVVEKDGKPFAIRARKGVVLAAGGFDKNQQMRDANAPLYNKAWASGGVTSNTGDAIRAGQAVGAGTMNMHSAWAAPVFHVPGEDRGRLCTIERALPGCIMVNQKGQRYLNEAASYHIVGQQMARRDPGPPRQFLRHYQPMAVLHVALEAQQRDAAAQILRQRLQ